MDLTFPLDPMALALSQTGRYVSLLCHVISMAALTGLHFGVIMCSQFSEEHTEYKLR